MTQSRLAELMQMEKISVSRQAERLEKAGWIERRDDRRDSRAYRLHPTPRASRVVAKLNRLADEMRGEYLAGLPPPRVDALIADLKLIRANLTRLRDASGPGESHSA